MKLCQALERLGLRCTIQTRLMFLITLLVAGISVFIYAYFPARLEQQAIQSLVDKTRSIGAMSAFSASAAVMFEDPQSLEEIFASASQNEELLYMVAVASSGHPVAALNEAEARRMDYLRVTRRISSADTIYKAATPILLNDREIGRLYLGLSLQDIGNRVDASRRTVALVSILVFAFSLFVTIGISKIITRPLAQMVETVQDISAGDLSRRIDDTPSDEVGRLASAFNRMVGHVEERTEALYQEISERERAEEALQKSEKHLQFLLSASPTVIYSRTVEGKDRATFISQNVTSMIGYTPEDFLTTRHLWRQRVHPEDAPQVFSALPGIPKKDHLVLEYRLRHKDGTYRWLHDEVRMARNPEGDPVEIVGAWTDITAQKQAEEARLKVEEELETQRTMTMRSDRLRSLGEMAAGIAHELNQPLVGVRGLAEHTLIGMQRGWDLTEDKLKDRLTRIIEQADRMVHIIQHVRMFAREAGKTDVLPVQVNDVVQSSLDMLGAQFRAHGLTLEANLSDALPAVLANAYSLEEVLINLLNNARDAVEDRMQQDDTLSDPRIHIRTRQARNGQASWVTIEVEDTGKGIPPEIISKVFEPFFTTKDPDKGTGLGLSVSKSIVENFGGHLKIDSTAGSGTTITIVLPEDVGSHAQAH